MEGRLSEKTWVPASVAVAAVGLFMGAAWWVKGTLAEIVFEQRLTSERVGRMEKQLDDIASQNVSERDMRLWIMGLKRENEGKIAVPEWFR